jgi:hypothetical protein
LEPFSLISFAISQLTNSYKLFKELSKNNIITHSRAMIDWENGTLEQQWTFNNSPANRSLAYNLFNNYMKIPNVSKEIGFVYPGNQTDLFKLGILSKEDNTLKINLKKIGSIENSQTVVIRFITPFDNKVLYSSLCEKHLQKSPQFLDDNTTVYSFSIMLNWAHVWKEDFESVRYTNILLPYDMNIDKKTIEDSLPDQLKEKLVSNARLALQKRSDAMQYLSALNQNIKHLEQEEIKDKLLSFIHVEAEHADVNIHTIICKASSYTIGDGYELLLPDSFHIEIACSLDASEQAIKGKVIFYRKGLKNFISEMFSELMK